MIHSSSATERHLACIACSIHCQRFSFGDPVQPAMISGKIYWLNKTESGDGGVGGSSFVKKL